ncbi:MAG TPA: CapA family protein [Brevefilum fermentans]|nr:CapA family protein [Brevefilum fermentans]
MTLSLLLISACVSEPVFNELPPDPTPLLPTFGNPPTATPTQDPTATPAPLTLYLSEKLPSELIALDAISGVVISADPTASLWFGPAVEAPSGEVLQTSALVFALAAPFPTLLDDISLDELQAYWLGMTVGRLDAVTRLYVPELLFQVLVERWGTPGEARIQSFQEPPEIAALWEDNAWMLLPFEELNPQLKVIQVDGSSPLFKDFDPESYPFTLQFQLVHKVQAASIPADVLESLLSAVQPGNRDPEMLTTLVMTGVTALVRATAYRMEMYGVTYPGEKVRHWLTEADLTHISNEVSFYEDCPFPDPTSERLLFCSDPKYLELFKEIGVDIIELTGNHNNDSLIVYGVDVVPFTLDLYDEHGMHYFGGGRNLAEAKTPLLITHNGNKLAFIGCNAFGPDFAWATDAGGGSAPCEDYQWMAAEISRLRDEGYLPIATFQYFEDYYDFAADHHKRDFGIMADAGAVIVNGSQSHRPKAMTFSGDAFIHYGLGNLFFDQNWYVDMYGNVIVQTSWEFIQRHTFYAGRHLSVELLTAKLIDYAQPRPMTEEERALFLTEIFTASGWDVR